MGATDAKIYKSREDEEFKLKQNYVRLGELYKESQNAVRIVDTSTGESIPLQSISDAIRLSKRGDQLDVDKTVVYDHIIPNKLLDDFVISSSQHFNARSCVEALGLYCTEYMKYQVTHLGDKQNDLSAMEDRTAEANLTFRNYIKGGASARNPITGEPAQSEDENDDVKRVTPNLGIGLGEATVLNPTFQFNKRDDPRTNPMYTKIGRVYSTQIMNNWPIIVFQPGRLKYHTGFMKIMGLGGGAGVTEAFIRSGGEGIKGAFLNMLSFGSDIAAVVGTIGSGIFGGSKLVEFRQSANLFNKYVSYLWSMLGQLMGLYSDSGNFNYHYAGEIKHLDATHVLPTTLLSGGPAKYLANQYWPFRIQKGMIGSETFSNSTETNPLMEEMNQQSTANDEAGATQNSFLGSIAKKVQGFLGNFSDKAAVLAGRGKIALPNIYSSSSFSRSISCSFEFHYPYNDPLGNFENVWIPFLALLTMGLARQTGKLTYTSPFAIRAYIKNHIMISYGMITNITVTRGGDNNDWGPSGYPKTVKCDVTIEDMEPNISLPLASRGPLRAALEMMFPASGISEYLSTIGGLSLHEMTHNFTKGHFSRAVGVFRSAWGSKMNADNFFASVANTRLISNVLSLFSSVDLDKYNQMGDINRLYQRTAQDNMAQNGFAMGGFGYMFSSGYSENGFRDKSSEQKEDAVVIGSVEKDVGQHAKNIWGTPHNS